MRQQVEQTIEAIRPALQADGGDMFLRDVDEETGVVTVSLIGRLRHLPCQHRDPQGRHRADHEGSRRGRHRRRRGVAAPDSFRVRAPCATETLQSCSPLPVRAIAARLARLLSLVEQGGSDARDVGRLAYPLGGNAYTVGLTGAPGAGKSTLTSQLIALLRGTGSEVAVLAIDPSSPFSGGAILGDRVRMQDHATDSGVFIRSMATRGHLGGLALAAPEAIRLLDAVGKPWVLVETVGVGQVEVEIAGEADTTVVVVNPGWGDAVQANKAGLLEIGDVFVINKADRTGVAETRRDLEQMLDLSAARRLAAADRAHGGVA